MSNASPRQPYKSPVPLPEGRERELLVILGEEAAEVIQRASKALRFGITEVQEGQELDNSRRLAHEVGDLLAVVHLLVEQGVLVQRHLDTAARLKRERLGKWLQSEDEGQELDLRDMWVLDQLAVSTELEKLRRDHNPRLPSEMDIKRHLARLRRAGLIELIEPGSGALGHRVTAAGIWVDRAGDTTQMLVRARKHLMLRRHVLLSTRDMHNPDKLEALASSLGSLGMELLGEVVRSGAGPHLHYGNWRLIDRLIRLELAEMNSIGLQPTILGRALHRWCVGPHTSPS